MIYNSFDIARIRPSASTHQAMQSTSAPIAFKPAFSQPQDTLHFGESSPPARAAETAPPEARFLNPNEEALLGHLANGLDLSTILTTKVDKADAFFQPTEKYLKSMLNSAAERLNLPKQQKITQKFIQALIARAQLLREIEVGKDDYPLLVRIPKSRPLKRLSEEELAKIQQKEQGPTRKKTTPPKTRDSATPSNPQSPPTRTRNPFHHHKKPPSAKGPASVFDYTKAGGAGTAIPDFLDDPKTLSPGRTVLSLEEVKRRLMQRRVSKS